MSDDKAMEQRLRDYLKRSEIETTETSIGWALAFAFDEVQSALAPREPSPELAEAELRLRSPICEVKGSDARAIAGELDRLRAENAQLRARKVTAERAGKDGTGT